jgi:hypothetical protein
LLYKGNVFKLSVALLTIVLLIGCGEKRVTEFSQDEIEPVSCVIVMPTKIPYEHANKSTEAREELRSGAVFLEDVLRQELQKSRVARVIDSSQLRSQAYDLSGGAYNALQKIGKEEKCETALLSTISNFSRRQGTEYAVDEPASAAFELKLIDTQTGRNLWMSSFNEAQVSLMSNLLSFKTAMSRGFKWITAEDLVAGGAQEKLRKCAYFY